MSGRLSEVEARIGTVHKLAAVIAAMRGIAAARAREAQGQLAGIRTYAATIGTAIAQSLALLPDRAPAPAPNGGGRRAVVLFAAEQGFAGGFSARVFDAAAPLLAAPHMLLLAGDRGLLVADERGLAVDWSVPMISHPGQAGALAARITEAIYARLAAGEATAVTLVHAAPDGPVGNIVTRTLVPFDYARFPAPPHAVAPRITLPPDALLARLAEEYVFAEIAEAVMLSFAAENEARMRAMIAAHDNVSETLSDLIGQSRRLRQEEITDEITELATASLPLR